MQSIFDIYQAKPLPSPYELKKQYPATPSLMNFVKKSQEGVKAILQGKDQRLLAIIGPCSIHDENSALEYARRVKELSKKVEESFLIVMRSFFEKPRTGYAWKGLLYDPFLNGSCDLLSGLSISRKFLIDLAELGVPAALEILDPLASQYFSDLISWGCIGARTSESQVHRQIASSLLMPIGFKNTTAGNVQSAINGAIVASQPHGFIGIDDLGRISSISSPGNPNTHIILRGSEHEPNYDSKSINLAMGLLSQTALPRKLLIDCSHGNSAKNYLRQIQVFNSVLNQIIDGNHNICGLLLESHLNEGSQQFRRGPEFLQYGISITDPCISWQTTEDLLIEADKYLRFSDRINLTCHL